MIRFRLLSVVFFLLSTLAISQSFYHKDFKDSTNAAIFGQVSFMEEDSLNLYLVTNTTYSTGFCSSTTGINFVIKVNKQNGAVISSKVLSGNPFAMKVTAGCKHNQALYMGGEIGDLSSRHYVILKYDLITKQVVWSLPLATYYPGASQHITRIKFNNTTGNLLFVGPGRGPFQPSSAINIGEVDTLGNFVNSYNYGITYNSALMTDPSFDFSKYKNNYYVLSRDFNSDSVYVSCFNNNSIFSNNHRNLNVFSDGTNFSIAFSKYILHIIGRNNSFTCFFTDTAFNFIKAKKFNNLYFKSVGVGKNKAVLTCVNNYTSFYGKEIINIKIDTNLNIISSKRMFVDTFYINGFTSATIYNESSDAFFNLISKSSVGTRSVKLYKSTFPTLYCNELSYSPSTNTLAITSMSATSLFTGAITPTAATIVDGVKGFKDSLICSGFAGINDYPITEKHFEIYPNPVEELLFVKLQSNNEEPYVMRIIDVFGREVIRVEFDGKPLNVRHLPKGIYFMNFYSGNGQFQGCSKFVKTD